MSETKREKHLWMVDEVSATASKPARSYWTKIGVAFENRDGSWNLELSALPISGKLQMRDPVPAHSSSQHPQLDKTFGCVKCGADIDDGAGCLKHGKPKPSESDNEGPKCTCGAADNAVGLHDRTCPIRRATK